MFGELCTIHMANNTEMGQNSISLIPVKSDHGYSPKYAEQIFNVIGLSLCRHGLDHKLPISGPFKILCCEIFSIPSTLYCHIP